MSSSRKSCELFTLAGSKILSASPKSIALSGPSGFLGSQVLDSILDIFLFRHENKVEPGKILLLTSSPGRLMKRLSERYGRNKMQFIRASRVDFFTQHNWNTWKDNLASLGFVDSDGLVFCNLAAIAGPLRGSGDRLTAESKSRMTRGHGEDVDRMMDVNYRAVCGAARACEQLGFEHFIQSSSQAVNVERAGQVLYARGKAMADAMLLQRKGMNATSIVRLGLLYCRESASLGQDGDKLNLVDLAKLPLTPILGNGLAPLQPMDRRDAADRLAFLATVDAKDRPSAKVQFPGPEAEEAIKSKIRIYDAVGPEILTMKELLEVMARFQGRTLYPIHVNYYNMERILNVASLGNYNRQFVSILRSEQDIDLDTLTIKATANPTDFLQLYHENATMCKIEEAFDPPKDGQYRRKRMFPFLSTAKWVYRNPGVIRPGIALGLEISRNFLMPSYQEPFLEEERAVKERESAESISSFRWTR